MTAATLDVRNGIGDRERDALAAEQLRRCKRRRKRKYKLNQIQERSTSSWVPGFVNFGLNRRVQIVQVSCGGDMIGAHTVAVTR